jgi:hypothetical protein
VQELFIEDLLHAAERGQHVHYFSAAGMPGSYFCLPLHGEHGTPIGVLGVDTLHTGDALTPGDLDLIRRLMRAFAPLVAAVTAEEDEVDAPLAADPAEISSAVAADPAVAAAQAQFAAVQVGPARPAGANACQPLFGGGYVWRC